MALLSLPSICIDQETGANVTVNCVHPGIVRTRLNRDRDGILTGTVRDAHCQLLHEWNNKISFPFFCFFGVGRLHADLVFLLLSKLLKTIPQVIN